MSTSTCTDDSYLPGRVQPHATKFQNTNICRFLNLLLPELNNLALSCKAAVVESQSFKDLMPAILKAYLHSDLPHLFDFLSKDLQNINFDISFVTVAVWKSSPELVDTVLTSFVSKFMDEFPEEQWSLVLNLAVESGSYSVVEIVLKRGKYPPLEICNFIPPNLFENINSNAMETEDKMQITKLLLYSQSKRENDSENILLYTFLASKVDKSLVTELLRKDADIFLRKIFRNTSLLVHKQSCYAAVDEIYRK